MQEHRGTSQFIEIDGKVKRRPDLHSVGERLLRLSQPRIDARGRIRKLTHRSGGLSGPRPIVSEHIEAVEGLEVYHELKSQRDVESDTEGTMMLPGRVYSFSEGTLEARAHQPELPTIRDRAIILIGGRHFRVSGGQIL